MNQILRFDQGVRRIFLQVFTISFFRTKSKWQVLDPAISFSSREIEQKEFCHFLMTRIVLGHLYKIPAPTKRNTQSLRNLQKLFHAKLEKKKGQPGEARRVAKVTSARVTASTWNWSCPSGSCSSDGEPPLGLQLQLFLTAQQGFENGSRWKDGAQKN